MIDPQKMKPLDLGKVLKKYSGDWIALIPNSNKVAANGKELKEVVKIAKEKGIKNPVMLKARPAHGPYIG